MRKDAGVLCLVWTCAVFGCAPPPTATVVESDSGREAELESESSTVSPAEMQALLARLSDRNAPAPGDENRRNAPEVVAAALAEAKRDNKRVFVHYGADWCVWCSLLEESLEQHRDLLAPDYVFVKIDESTMKNTDEVGEPWGKRAGEGIPWMAILDSDSHALVTSNDGPTGENIGHPVDSEELDHFMQMIKQTTQRLTPEQLAELRTRWEKQTREQRREVYGPIGVE